MSKRQSTKFALFLGLFSLVGCNAVTGVDDLTIEKAGDGPKVILEPLLTIPGITVSGISLYQGIKVPLMADGMPAMSTLPIVASRDAMIRVFVATDGNYTGEPVTARLFLEGNPQPYETTVDKLHGASVENDLTTTINFNVPGSAITADTKYKVLIGKPSGPIPTGTTSVIYPASGWDPIPAQSVGPNIKVKLLPVKYGADGSGRLPDTSDEILKQYADGFRAMYPIPDIELTVHDPVDWQKAISPDGTGWDTLLTYITGLRQQEGAPPDVYYFAIFMPAASFGQYCGGGCVLGLANLSMTPGDAYARAGIGAAFGDRTSVETALHEVGHTHGRHHSPSCGAAGPDPNFPYPDGKDGVWGYDASRNMFFDPAATYDVMGYCTPYWISDYTFQALFDRIKAVNNAEIHVPAELRDRTYDRVSIDPHGGMTWLPPLKMALPPQGEERTVQVEAGGSIETRTGQFFGFDHLEGGTLLWPRTEGSADAVRFQYRGQLVRVAR